MGFVIASLSLAWEAERHCCSMTKAAGQGTLRCESTCVIPSPSPSCTSTLFPVAWKCGHIPAFQADQTDTWVWTWAFISEKGVRGLC